MIECTCDSRYKLLSKLRGWWWCGRKVGWFKVWSRRLGGNWMESSPILRLIWGLIHVWKVLLKYSFFFVSLLTWLLESLQEALCCCYSTTSQFFQKSYINIIGSGPSPNIWLHNTTHNIRESLISGQIFSPQKLCEFFL